MEVIFASVARLLILSSGGLVPQELSLIVDTTIHESDPFVEIPSFQNIFSFDASCFDVILRKNNFVNFEDFELDTYGIRVVTLNKCAAC